MINKLCKSFYDMLYRMDKRNGSYEGYDYETAPYCGHHYSGHHGRYTKSDYHEGMGGCEGRLGPIWVSKNSEERDWYWRIIAWKKPPVVWRKKIADRVYQEVTFHGFIGYRRGFRNKWFTTLVPFAHGFRAWHFLGFRFTKTTVVKY